MKCYYEELCVEREASDAEIKTAYRKLALRWHPDKNPNNIEAAKEQFQLIQQAYDVLSDKHERAWYDNHREQILRGKNSEYEDNCLDLFQFFTVSCYKGYGDDTKGFYSVFAEVFEKIAAEDVEFMEDEEEVARIPKFGNSKSSYEEVVGPFYAYWQSYCTKKTYTWLCPYDIQEIKDRRVLREIEKELKKIVQKAKKERNEEVRNLVSFIRKRDKRVQNYKEMLEERAALNRQKQEQKRLEQIQQRKKELEEIRKNRAHTLNDAYEEQLKQLEQEYSDLSSSYEETENEDEDDEQLIDGITDLDVADEEEEIYVDDLYCVACNKAFKNEKALGNHETSKKHRDNVERLKQEMLDEEQEIFTELEEEDDSASIKAENNEDLSSDKVQHEGNMGLYDCISESDIDVDLATQADTIQEEQPKLTKKDKKSRKANKSNHMTFAKELDSEGEDKVRNATIHDLKASDESDNNDWGSSSKKYCNKKAKNKQTKNKQCEIKGSTIVSAEKSSKEQPLEMATATAPVPNPAPVTTTFDEAAEHRCVTCNATFESKNKLFAHLKKLNHGVYIPKTKPAPVETGKKSKSKRK